MDIHFYRGSIAVAMGATPSQQPGMVLQAEQTTAELLHSRALATANSKVLEVIGSGFSTQGLSLEGEK
jgi:hypothetical protein